MYLTEDSEGKPDHENAEDSADATSTGFDDVTSFTPPQCCGSSGQCHCCLIDLGERDCDCPARKWVALNVRRLRARENLSQQQLSARANIHRTHLARFETQAINISLSVLFKIARGLQVDPRELLKPPRAQESLSGKE